MRAVWIGVGIASLCLVAAGDDVGVPVRSSAQDYPVRQSVPKATLAAAIVPHDQVAKMFSQDIARKYIVVEVAIYPENSPFDVEPFDFSLRVGDRSSHTEIPPAGAPWLGGPPPPAGNSPQVTAETGVIVERETDPYGRTVKTVGTYTGVAVSNGGAPPPPPPPSGPDPGLIDRRLRDKALGAGVTQRAVAGYLYFPQSAKKRKTDAVELQFTNDDGSFGLPFPK